MEDGRWRNEDGGGRSEERGMKTMEGGHKNEERGTGRASGAGVDMRQEDKRQPCEVKKATGAKRTGSQT
jgi:hypothetical protein